MANGSSATISNGQVLSGQTLTGGSIQILAGGLAADDTFYAPSHVEIKAGGSASDITYVGSGTGDFFIDAGGTVDGLVISLVSGLAFVLNSGTLENVTVESGGQITSIEGTISGAAIMSGGTVFTDGGVANNVTVSAGGFLGVGAGSAVGTVIDSFAVASGIGDTYIDTIVSQGGELVVDNAVDTTVESGGVEVVSGSISGGTVESGGIVIVASGATVADLTVNPGGVVISTGALILENAGSGFVVESSALTLEGISAGGTAEILSGGTIAGSTLTGDVKVASGGIVISTTVDGALTLSAGGVAADVVLGSAALATISGAFEGGTVYGTAYIYSGSTFTDATLGSGAIVSEQDEGQHNVSNITVLGGGTGTFTGDVANLTVDGGTVELFGGTGADANNSVFAGGVLTIIGGTEQAAQVGSGGTLEIGRDGVTSDTIIEAGGFEIIGSNMFPTRTTDAYGYDDVVESGGTLIVSGAGVASGTTIEAGGLATITSGGSAADVNVDGGTLVIRSGGVIDGVSFSATGGTLDITNSSILTSNAITVTGFTSGDSIDFAFLTPSAGDTLSSSGDTLTISAGGQQYTLSVAGAQSEQLGLTSATDGHLELAVVCYYPGTHIRTAAGGVPVEQLAPGDHVITVDGRTLPIRWVGLNTVSTRFADPLRVLPIRLKAGALADGVPERDLLVSPEHALFAGGILVQAGALVNGLSILREANVPETFTYYHIEVAEHALLLAEGVPAESFVDNVDRRAFDNWQEYEALYGTVPIPEMPFPRALSHCQVPTRLRAALLLRAQNRFAPVATSAA